MKTLFASKRMRYGVCHKYRTFNCFLISLSFSSQFHLYILLRNIVKETVSSITDECLNRLRAAHETPFDGKVTFPFDWIGWGNFSIKSTLHARGAMSAVEFHRPGGLLPSFRLSLPINLLTITTAWRHPSSSLPNCCPPNNKTIIVAGIDA